MGKVVAYIVLENGYELRDMIKLLGWIGEKRSTLTKTWNGMTPTKVSIYE
jgi:hypothetical protein